MPHRILAGLALAALLSAPGGAEAQGRKAPPAKAAAPAEPAPPPIYPCRTQEEVCHLGVVIGSQVAIVFTNAPQAQALEPKLMDVTGPDGAKIDLSKNAGRVVMLTGELDPKGGVTKAEVVEVASPLASMAIKAQLGAGGDEPAAGAAKGGGRRR